MHLNLYPSVVFEVSARRITVVVAFFVCTYHANTFIDSNRHLHFDWLLCNRSLHGAGMFLWSGQPVLPRRSHHQRHVSRLRSIHLPSLLHLPQHLLSTESATRLHWIGLRQQPAGLVSYQIPLRRTTRLRVRVSWKRNQFMSGRLHCGLHPSLLRLSAKWVQVIPDKSKPVHFTTTTKPVEQLPAY